MRRLPLALLLAFLAGCPEEEAPPVDCSKFADCVSCTDANGARKACGWCATGVVAKCVAADDATCEGGAGTSRVACCAGASLCQSCASLAACVWDAANSACGPANLPDGGLVSAPTEASDCEGGCAGFTDCGGCDAVRGCGWCDDGAGSARCIAEDVTGQPSESGCVDYATTRKTCP